METVILAPTCDCEDSYGVDGTAGDIVCVICSQPYQEASTVTVTEEFEKLDRLIKASEDWAKSYRQDDASFAQLIKAESKLTTVFARYFRELAERAVGYVSWSAYEMKLREVTAADNFNVDVIVSEIPDEEDGIVMQITYEPLATAVEAGLIAAEIQYRIVLPETSIPELVSQVARERIAYLVGKRIDKDGNIVPAKRPEYHINEVTRQQIRDSIRTSLSLGENRELATKRLQKRIADPKRAQKIAATESVNAFQGGQYEYALKTGATRKRWQGVPGACPTCMMNIADGPIPITATFSSGHIKPSAHPYDRCGIVYEYDE